MPEEINHAADQPKRNSFVFFTGYAERFRSLSDEQFGILVRAMINYQITGEIPHFTDQVLSLSFDIVKVDMDLNNEKYLERIVFRNRINGRKGGRPKAENPTKPNGLFKTQTNPENPMEPKKPENDNENDNDNVNDNVNVIYTDRLIDRDNISQSFGKNQNVYLTAAEFQYLKTNYPDMYQSKIERRSDHKQKHPDSIFSSDFEVLKKWCEEDSLKLAQEKGEINAIDNQTMDKGKPLELNEFE